MYLSSNEVKGADPDPIFIFRSSDCDVTALKCFEHHNCKSVVVSGSINGMVRFWNTVTRRPYHEIQAGNGSSILHIDIIVNRDNNIIMVTQDRSGRIIFWNADEIESIKTESCWLISAVGFCPIDVLEKDTGEYLIAFAYCESEVTVKEYDVDIDTIQLKSNEKKGMVMSLNMYKQSDKFYLIVGYEDGCVILWNILNKITLSSIKLYDDPVMATAFDSNTSRLLVSSASDILQLVNIDDDDKLSISQTLNVQFSGCSSMCLRHDGKIVLVGGWDGKIRIFSWKKMKLLAVLKYHTGTINALSFDKNNHILSGSKDGRISVWDVYSNK